MKNIIPLLDDATHQIGTGCHCRPETKEGLVIHNSFDQRELWEKEGFPTPGKRWGIYSGHDGLYALGSYKDESCLYLYPERWNHTPRC